MCSRVTFSSLQSVTSHQLSENFNFLINNNSRHFARKYARIFVRGHYLFREANSFVSYEEQIMSNDKHPSIFSPQMATIVFIIPQIFFATRTVLKTGEYLTTIHRSGGG